MGKVVESLGSRTWKGTCCFCKRPLSCANFDRQELIATVDAPRDFIVAMCAQHAIDDMAKAVRSMALEVARHISGGDQ
jgi:hypothetical protein